MDQDYANPWDTDFPPFEPHPYIPGPHAQTILGLFLPQPRSRPAAHCRQILLADGDLLALHESYPSPRDGQRIVLLVHGLAGNHDSPYIRRVAVKLMAHGFAAFRLDQRGCGAGATWARGVFHAARSADLFQTVGNIAHRYPGCPITLCGYSLGANLLLKMLGTEVEHLPRQVDSAIAISPPIDLQRCVAIVRQGFNRVYDQFFVRRLWHEYQARVRAGRLPRVHGERRPSSLWEFDEQITARLAGFASAEEYYAAASSVHELCRIKVPTLLITAADDPLIPHVLFETAAMSTQLTWRPVPRGGHLGFVGRSAESIPGNCAAGALADRRWLDWRVVQAVRALAKKIETE